MKKVIVISWLAILFSGVIILFWYNEWVYSLPTPVPKSYKTIKQGEIVHLGEKFNSPRNKPLLLHFFNPDCPCSRFNIKHVKSLIELYGDKVDFTVVVLNKDNNYTSADIQKKFGLNVPVLFDKSIADSCGVYSTPQAVILNTNNTLYYKGNYNKSRYCTLKESDYAQMAIDSLLNDSPNPTFSSYALTAYGCQLPNCNK